MSRPAAASLIAIVLSSGCWSGTCHEPEFVYVRPSREPATCRALSRWMRRLPEPPGATASEKCAQDPSTFEWCLYVAEYNYAWELQLWVSEVVAACREDGPGPDGDDR